MSSHHHIFDDMTGGIGTSNGPGNGSVHTQHHLSHVHNRSPNTRLNSSSSSSNCQLRGKWEILLVFLVIFSGIVLTTLAVIKAKEKRNTQQQHIPAENNILPVIERSSFSPPTAASSPKSSSNLSKSSSSSSSSLATSNLKNKVADAIIPLSDKPYRTKQSKKHRTDAHMKDASSRNSYQVEGEFGDNKLNHNSRQSTRNKPANTQHDVQQQQQQQQQQQLTNQQQQPQQSQQSSTAEPSTSVSLPYDFAADSSTLIKVRPKHNQNGNGGSMLIHYDGLPAYPGPAGKTVVLPKAELTVNGAGFVRQLFDTNAGTNAAGRLPLDSSILGGGGNVGGGGEHGAVDLVPEGSSRHATRVSGQRMPGRSGGNRFVVDPNANYISTKELLWLQRQRPELFQSPTRAMTQTPSLSHHSQLQQYHSPNVGQNYRQLQHHRMRRAVNEYKVSNNKNRKNSSYRRNENSSNTINSNSGQNLYSVASRKIEKRYGILGSGNFEIIRGGILPDEPTKRPKSKPKSNSESLPENDNSVVDNSSIENNNDDSENNNNNTDGEAVTDDNNTNVDDAGNDTEPNDGENNSTPTDEQNNNSQESNGDDSEDGNPNNNPLDDTFEPLNLDIFGNQDPFAGLQSKRNNNVL